MPSTIKRILEYVTGEAFKDAQPLAVPPEITVTSNATGQEQSGTAGKQSLAKTSLAEQAQRVLSPKISEEEKEANRKRLK